jgi:hypothetical protein
MAVDHVGEPVTARDAAAGTGQAGAGTGTRVGPSGWVSLVVAALSYGAVPALFLGTALLSVARGWQPTSDDALFAWRAWDVVSARPPLLGAPTHGYGTAHQVYAPGPVLSWLLAAPTHLAPRTAPLIGSALLAGVLAVVAVAAARAWRSEIAGLLAALAFVLVCTAEQLVVLNPLWTPWIGVVALMTALACALPVLAGRLGWATGLVATASTAAQAHVVYALPAVVVGCIAVVGGTVVARRDGARPPIGRPLLLAAAVGLLLWSAPLVAEVADTPGNLALLWHARSAGGPSVGWSFAFHGLASAVAPDPSWLHGIPQLGPAAPFEAFAQLFGSPVWWAAVGLAVQVAAVGWGSRDNRPLRDLAVVGVATSLATVATVAAIPRRDLLELGYLGVVFLPAGILTWYTTGWLAVDTVRRRLPVGTGRRAARRRRDVGLLATGCVLAVATGLLAARLAAQIPGDTADLGGPTALRATTGVADQVARAVPPGRPFRLSVTGHADPLMLYAVQSGAAYRLKTEGWRPQLPQRSANAQFGISAVGAAHAPVVSCPIDGGPCRVEEGVPVRP